MAVFNEDMRVKIPATIQFLRIGYSYQSLREADVDFNTKIFINRFKPALEKINDREFSYDEISATGFSADEVALLFEDEVDYGLDDFEWYEEAQSDYGRSCIITLKFASANAAEKWCAENGYEGKIKKNSKTTVIRVEE